MDPNYRSNDDRWGDDDEAYEAWYAEHHDHDEPEPDEPEPDGEVEMDERAYERLFDGPDR